MVRVTVLVRYNFCHEKILGLLSVSGKPEYIDSIKIVSI